MKSTWHRKDLKKLKEHEKQTLELLAQGCTSKEIGNILSKATCTINGQIYKLKSDFDAKTREHLIAILIKNNMILTDDDSLVIKVEIKKLFEVMQKNISKLLTKYKKSL